MNSSYSVIFYTLRNHLNSRSVNFTRAFAVTVFFLPVLNSLKSDYRHVLLNSGDDSCVSGTKISDFTVDRLKLCLIPCVGHFRQKKKIDFFLILIHFVLMSTFGATSFVYG